MIQPLRYIIYCDESFTQGGSYRYHHYYGGILIEESQATNLEKFLKETCDNFRIDNRELKWQNVDKASLNLFQTFINAFFDKLDEGWFKIRILFLDRYFSPQQLTEYHHEHGFYILYYIFITRAFGLQYGWKNTNPIVLRLFFDKLPDENVKSERFKAFLRTIEEHPLFSERKLKIPSDGISEIDSKRHLIAQAIDLVIGAIGFRMNDLYKVKQANGQRGKRTIAKEKLYKVIYWRLHKHGVINPGVSKGLKNREDLWNDAARLWRLRPEEFKLNSSWIKK